MKLFAITTALASAATFAGVWVATAPPEAAPPTPATAPAPAPADVRSITYSGCNEVRAAGKAPLMRDDPGYDLSMDGDGDGIACEAVGSGTSFEGGTFGRRRRR